MLEHLIFFLLFKIISNNYELEINKKNLNLKKKKLAENSTQPVYHSNPINLNCWIGSKKSLNPTQLGPCTLLVNN